MTTIRDLADRKTAVSRDRNASLCLWLLGIALVGGCTDARRSSCADGTATDCEAGFVCVEEQCVPCVTDEECTLADRYGNASSCVDGICCETGAPGCGCFAGGTCGWQATCGDEGCLDCVAGTDGCPCGEGDACDGELGCLEGVCARPSCTAGAAGCPCTADGGCDWGAVCSGERTCATCVPGALDCPCLEDGSCMSALTCVADVCTDCVAGARGCPCDAEACDVGLVCADGTCEIEERTCAELDCFMQGRLCEGEPVAECTACDSANDYVPDGRGGCLLNPAACQSGADCAADEQCLRLVIDGPATCVPVPSCAEVDAPTGSMGAAWDPRIEECVSCASCEGVAGSTGRIWPVTTEDGRCVCETADGFFFDAAAASTDPVPCDVDGDGWVQYRARQYVETRDLALRENARCDVRRIASFALRNERGEERLVRPRDLGLDVTTLGLYESEVTDSDERIARDLFMPSYGAQPLRAAQLNPLTKACVDERADFNDNDIADIAENPGSTSTLTWMAPFWRMSYFVALHDGWFEAGAAGEPGMFVVAERPRCAAGGFPLGYSSPPSEYWRECSRRRGTGFDRRVDQAGYDFAEWTCSDARGSCPPPTDIDLTDGELDASSARLVGATVDSAGLARHTGCTPVDPTRVAGSWLGMGHHSQFTCAKLVTSAPMASYELPLSGFGPPPIMDSGGLRYDLNSCDAAATSLTVGGAEQVDVSCTVATTEPADGTVGWVAYRYDVANDDSYARGCQPECRSLLSLCPSYHADPALNESGCVSNPDDFGALACNTCTQSGLSCVVGSTHGICLAGTYGCIADDDLCVSDASASVTDPFGDGRDENCDGFDGIEAEGIFVSNSGDDSSDGTQLAPVSSLTRAFALVSGTRRTIYMAQPPMAGGYTMVGPIALPDGVSIVGGLIHADEYSEADFAAECVDEHVVCGLGDTPLSDGLCLNAVSFCQRLLPMTGTHRTILSVTGRVGVEATDLTNGRLQGLELRVAGGSTPPAAPTATGASGASGGSTYGLIATNSVGLVIEDSVIDVGPGQDGSSAAGFAVAAGDGSSGGTGGRACIYRNRDGGVACAKDCRGVDSNLSPLRGTGGGGCLATNGGGDGGGGRDHITTGAHGYAGSGAGGPLDAPGALGIRDGACSATLCGSGVDAQGGDFPVPSIHLGLDGGNGTPGGDGTAPSPRFDATGYDNPVAGAGTAGGHGGGGAGGGGAGGGYVAGGTGGCRSYGASGGGGGGGACGGGGGGGGGSGGGSFGLYLSGSTVTLTGSVIRAGAGGDGGSGSLGQGGGVGGAGGLHSSSYGGFRGLYTDPGTINAHSNSGRGGRGGDGGGGGDGTPGAGGPSIGILFSDASSTYTADATTSITPGLAGSGGVNPMGGAVPPGLDGTVADVHRATP